MKLRMKIALWLMRPMLKRRSNRIAVLKELYSFFENTYYEDNGYSHLYNMCSELFDANEVSKMDLDAMKGGVVQELCEVHRGTHFRIDIPVDPNLYRKIILSTEDQAETDMILAEKRKEKKENMSDAEVQLAKLYQQKFLLEDELEELSKACVQMDLHATDPGGLMFLQYKGIRDRIISKALGCAVITSTQTKPYSKPATCAGLEVIIDGKIGRIDKMFVSELGFWMVRVEYPDEGRFVTHNLGKYVPFDIHDLKIQK